MLKVRFHLLLLIFLGSGFAAPAKDKIETFGSTERSESALIGILYDLKQNQKREPVPMEQKSFLEILARFIDDGWDEGILNKYYRVSHPLYATELVIDKIDADLAPKAFGVEKTVKPRLWVVYYKGQVSPPQDGTYRFVGFADNYLAVAINAKTVLVTCLPSSVIPTKWYPKEKKTGLWGRREECLGGDWIDLKAGQIVDIDIIFGEVPGGDCSCFLGIQKKGEELPLSKHRGLRDPHPFQLTRSSHSLPNTIPWKGVQ